MLQRSGPAYIRVLGADAKGLEILRRMKTSSSLPVLGKAPVRGTGPGRVLARLNVRPATCGKSSRTGFLRGGKEAPPPYTWIFPGRENVP